MQTSTDLWSCILTEDDTRQPPLWESSLGGGNVGTCPVLFANVNIFVICRRHDFVFLHEKGIYMVKSVSTYLTHNRTYFKSLSTTTRRKCHILGQNVIENSKLVMVIRAVKITEIFNVKTIAQ